MKLTELRGLASQLGVARPPSKKEDLIAAIVAAASIGNEPVESPSSGAGIAVQHTAACCELASALGRAGKRVFVLGEGLRAFPWEHAPSLVPEGWTRLPATGPLLVAAAAALQYRTGASAARHDGALAHLRVLGSRLMPALPPTPRSVAYALNPSGDLPSTEATLLPAVKALAKAWGRAPPVGWAGAGAQPPPEALSTAVRSASVYVYAGHGAGELILPRETVGVALSPCPPVLLMGCSSGRLESGRGAQAGASAFGRPVGAPPAYLASLCPQLAVCLWDVTDRDIDRFTVALLAEMAGGGRAGDGRAVARAACKLRSLVGAAVVWYGLG
jgi:separase